MLRKFIPLFGLVIVLAVAACGSSTPTATWTPVASPVVVTVMLPTSTVGALPNFTSVDPAKGASLRIVVAVPDAPLFDIYLESGLVGSRFTYGSISNAFAVAPGKYLLRAVPATT